MIDNDLDKNCLSYWFPKIEQAGLPVPRTSWFKTEVQFLHLFDNITPPGFGDFLHQLRAAIGDINTNPCFLRTGQCAAKHEWKRTCHYELWDSLADHVSNIVEYSEMVSVLGLPTNIWAAREMLPTKPLFYAFHGEMPIVREFRFFVRDDSVVYWIPYWPAYSLSRQTDDPDWLDKLAVASRMSPEEHEQLASLASRCGAAVGGDWSVDLLDTERGWYVTDMAVAQESYGYREEAYAE